MATTAKSFKPMAKNISYLNKDFNSFKSSLVDFAKSYYPNSYRDFSEGSVGMMFMEQAAYVGDVTAFYTDSQLGEGLIQLATERKNIVNKANSYGYKIKTSTPSQTILEVFQLLPSKMDLDGKVYPDYRFTQTILEGMQASTADGVSFITTSPIDFSVNTIDDPCEITVYQRDTNGIPQNYLLRKTVVAYSAELKTQTFDVGDPESFYKIYLPETNVIDIINVVDSDNNKWHQVDYLAQDLVSVAVENTQINDQFTSKYKNAVGYLLKYIRTSNRFTKNVTADNTTYLEFGAGTDQLDDEDIIPNVNTVGRGSPFTSRTGMTLDPSNFLNSRSYGRAPSNTTLTVTYLVGGGIESNVGSNEITNLGRIEFAGDTDELNPNEASLTQNVRSSIRVNNTIPATGGSGAETDDEIRQNAIAFISSQQRAVTKEDYAVRAYSMPSKFGSVAKVYVSSDSDLDIVYQSDAITPEGFNRISPDKSNQNSLNLYVLSYDGQKNLTQANEVLIENLKKYLSQYRMLTDSINILDGYIINIGVNIKISVERGYAKKDVIANCLSVAKDFFKIDNIQFSEPINISSLELEIAKVEGVQSVSDVNITNLTDRDGTYSPYSYNISEATRNKMIYPSLDPSVFEVKYPTKDIKISSL